MSMSDKEVLTELKKDGPDQLIKDVTKRGVDFEMTPDFEKKLRKAKATDEVIKAVTNASPKARAAAAKSAELGAGTVQLSAAETKDFNALKDELDPDKAISLAEAYLKQYPQSQVLSYIYSFEANAYQQKGDVVKDVDLCEKSLDLMKDNLMSLLMVTYAIPQPQYIKGHQTDEEKQLATAEAYAQDAFKVIDGLKKPSNESDEDFAKRKASYTAGIHGSLGMVHLDRAQLGLMGIDKEELAKAEKEYQLAVTTVDRPDSRDYYRLGETYRLEGKLDDAIAAFTKASELGGGSGIKEFADRQIELCKQMKAQAATAPKP